MQGEQGKCAEVVWCGEVRRRRWVNINNYDLVKTTLKLAQNEIQLPLEVNKKESLSQASPKTAT